MILSCDDACASDVRLSEIAQKYEVECIFYWPVEWRSLACSKGYKPLTFIEAMFIANNHEIGAHTITHRHLTDIDEVEAKVEILEGKLVLDALFNKDITKFCPPRGYISPELTSYALTIYRSIRLTRGENLVHIHPDSGANGNIDWKLRLDELIKLGVKDIELWGHSHEFDRYNLWDDLEQVLEKHASLEAIK
jgi:peptidoglycan/xylan/chitin deacetylase (PgdA/CDA1 family)